jgi:methylmalonyl-CoA mutase
MMQESEKDEKLFSEFPAVSASEWEGKIREDLQGADYDKKLVWDTGEGFRVMPYYRDENLKNIRTASMEPGEFPFVRGYRMKDNTWFIRQDIRVDDIRKASQKAMHVMSKGVNSVGFIFTPGASLTFDDFEVLCKPVISENAELNFEGYENPLQIVDSIDKLLEKNGINPQNFHGSADYDPLGRYSLTGTFPVSLKSSFEEAKNLIEASEKMPGFRVILVNGSNFRNSGSTIVQELGFTLAQGAEYLASLTESGVGIDLAAGKIGFRFGLGSNYFLEIAKLRAARMLWAQIVQAFGGTSEEVFRMNSHSVTSQWNKTMYDPHVNILRTTTEAMSAIISGTDSLTIGPYNSFYEEPSELSERIARNQQLLLKEESYFGKVADPGGGSYYIENLTASITAEAWKLFLAVQEKGGFTGALKEDLIQGEIEESARLRDWNIANRKEILLGTNQYPNALEVIENPLAPKVFSTDDPGGLEPEIKTLKPYRGAWAFELMRSRTDRYAKKNKRPKVFMLAIGDPAMRRARALFAGNFFACSGFEINNSPVYHSVDEAADACLKEKADIAVICSSDEEYATLAPALFAKLKDKIIVVVAGYPKAIMEDLKQQGIRHFIHNRSNVLESLNYFQELLGITDADNN